MLTTTAPQSLDGLINAASAAADAPWEALSERTARDAAEKVRFLYYEVQKRLETRQRTVESLLTTECQVGTRLYQVVRCYGWFNEVGEKERLLLYKDLRDIEKERRKLYEAGFDELHKLKMELAEALQEYRMLHRRNAALANTTPFEATPISGGQYDFPLVMRYLAPATAAPAQDDPPNTVTLRTP